MLGKSTPNRANEQAFDWDAFNRSSLLNLEQSIILCIQTYKLTYSGIIPARPDKVAHYEQELRDFYKREDVIRLLYPSGKSSAYSHMAPVTMATKPKRKKTIHLICITEDFGELADVWKYCPAFLDRYTSSEKFFDSEGEPGYRINEFEGESWHADHFVVSTPPVKK